MRTVISRSAISGSRNHARLIRPVPGRLKTIPPANKTPENTRDCEHQRQYQPYIRQPVSQTGVNPVGIPGRIRHHHRTAFTVFQISYRKISYRRSGLSLWWWWTLADQKLSGPRPGLCMLNFPHHYLPGRHVSLPEQKYHKDNHRHQRQNNAIFHCPYQPAQHLPSGTHQH